ncbi:MAG: hypothetical protein Q9228_007451 [Teloschistes exilis]
MCGLYTGTFASLLLLNHHDLTFVSNIGDVFRVSPNELSFASVASWKTIYGHPIPASKPTFVKSEFYDMYGAGFKKLCIGSERDPTKHGAMRKHLSAAFSTRALIEQESVVALVLDEFVDRIGWEEKFGEKERGINVTKWYEMVSFDVLGEMAFGKSFDCVRDGELETAPKCSHSTNTNDAHL